MCELASAAYYMEVEPLIDLTCKAIASSIDWSSPEAIRDAFGLPDDLTEEEKLGSIFTLFSRHFHAIFTRG